MSQDRESMRSKEGSRKRRSRTYGWSRTCGKIGHLESCSCQERPDNGAWRDRDRDKSESRKRNGKFVREDLMEMQRNVRSRPNNYTQTSNDMKPSFAQTSNEIKSTFVPAINDMKSPFAQNTNYMKATLAQASKDVKPIFGKAPKPPNNIKSGMRQATNDMKSTVGQTQNKRKPTFVQDTNECRDKPIVTEYFKLKEAYRREMEEFVQKKVQHIVDRNMTDISRDEVDEKGECGNQEFAEDISCAKPAVSMRKVSVEELESWKEQLKKVREEKKSYEKRIYQLELEVEECKRKRNSAHDQLKTAKLKFEKELKMVQIDLDSLRKEKIQLRSELRDCLNQNKLINEELSQTKKSLKDARNEKEEITKRQEINISFEKSSREKLEKSSSQEIAHLKSYLELKNIEIANKDNEIALKNREIAFFKSKDCILANKKQGDVDQDCSENVSECPLVAIPDSSDTDTVNLEIKPEIEESPKSPVTIKLENEFMSNENDISNMWISGIVEAEEDTINNVYGDVNTNECSPYKEYVEEDVALRSACLVKVETVSVELMDEAEETLEQEAVSTGNEVESGEDLVGDNESVRGGLCEDGENVHIEDAEPQIEFWLEVEGVNGETKFKCKLCGKLCSNKRCVMMHLRSHSQDKPFECSLCGAKMKSSGGKKLHERKCHPSSE